MHNAYMYHQHRLLEASSSSILVGCQLMMIWFQTANYYTIRDCFRPIVQ